jgi:hypothetical protein
MANYGLQVYQAGVVLHRDGRKFGWGPEGFGPRKGSMLLRGDRQPIAAWSECSQRRLEFIAANCAAEFKSFVTLTYHAEVESWEDVEGRNRRIVRRSKRDLNRFRSCLRREMGEHLWVQEFQARGVIHYHLLCEGELSRERCSAVWLRATGEWRDEAATRHAVKVEPVRGERGVRSYLGRYLGKGRQKLLPGELDGAGRWWGRSRGLRLQQVREIVTHFPEGGNMRQEAVCVRRSFCRWLSGELRFRVRSGVFIDWKGQRSKRAVRVVDELVRFYLREISGVAL